MDKSLNYQFNKFCPTYQQDISPARPHSQGVDASVSPDTFRKQSPIYSATHSHQCVTRETQTPFSLELLNILLLHHSAQRRILMSNSASPRKNKEVPVSPCIKIGNVLSLYSCYIYFALLKLWPTLLFILTMLTWNMFKLSKHISSVCFFPPQVWGLYVFPWHFLLQECPLPHLADEPKPPYINHRFHLGWSF